MVTLTTIGFTESTAEHFFGRLAAAGVATVIDVRLRPHGQLSGFAKAADLAWFLDRLGGIAYRHEPLLAPPPELLAEWRGRRMPWADYAGRYREVIARRRIERLMDPAMLDRGCLLCSEAKPHHCHRLVAAEYLAEHTPLEIRHL